MPLYRCHKKVWAVKIAAVKIHDDGAVTLTPVEPFHPFTIESGYAQKHNPQPGGYYVLYADGYQSFSPAQAFEEGYSLV